MRQSRIGLPLIVMAALILALVATAPVAAGGRPFSTTLRGANEAPAADPDATGTARIWVNAGQRTVCYTWSVSNAATPIAAAHIHKAVAGTNGPVVVPLAPTAASSGSGCVTNVNRALAQDIIQHPWDYYVNVHNSEFPGGVARGQLSRKP